MQPGVLLGMLGMHTTINKCGHKRVVIPLLVRLLKGVQPIYIGLGQP